MRRPSAVAALAHRRGRVARHVTLCPVTTDKRRAAKPRVCRPPKIIIANGQVGEQRPLCPGRSKPTHPPHFALLLLLSFFSRRNSSAASCYPAKGKRQHDADSATHAVAAGKTARERWLVLGREQARSMAQRKEKHTHISLGPRASGSDDVATLFF
jgi:hypothetical protein